MGKQNQGLFQLLSVKKQLERKVKYAVGDVEKLKRVLTQWKGKNHTLAVQARNLRSLLQKETCCNNELEKKRRKLSTEFQFTKNELLQEKALRKQIVIEKELLLNEKCVLEQTVNDLKLELELKEQELFNVTQEFQELMSNTATNEDVMKLKRRNQQLEIELKNEKEKIDNLADQIQILEQSKILVEASLRQKFKDHRKEIQQKDEEYEVLRNSSNKQIKALECQLESEHEERILLLKEKHDIERQFSETEEKLQSTLAKTVETNMKLKQDLKRTKAILKDSQFTPEQNQVGSYKKNFCRQLINQLEDLENAHLSAVKERQIAQAEAAESGVSLKEAERIKADLQEKLATKTKDCSNFESQLEENEQKISDLLNKYRNVVNQLITEQGNGKECMSQICQLKAEKSGLKKHVIELTYHLDNIEFLNNRRTTLTVKMLQLKNKELESKLELDQVTHARLEVQVSRFKKTVIRLQEEVSVSKNHEILFQESIRNLKRIARETEEEKQTFLLQNTELDSKCQSLEKKLAVSEVEMAAVKQDLKVALKRIEDLQSALGDIETDTHEMFCESISSDESLNSSF